MVSTSHHLFNMVIFCFYAGNFQFQLVINYGFILLIFIYETYISKLNLYMYSAVG